MMRPTWAARREGQAAALAGGAVAAAIVPHRPRASHGLRGGDDPRLGLKLVEESPKALRGREGRGLLQAPPKVPWWCGSGG